MPEHRDLPLFRWGEQLRRDRAVRRASRWRTLAAAGAAAVLTAVGATLLWPPRPQLLWNASASSPIGLYRVRPADSVRPGEMVVAWPPDEARRLGAARHYLPSNVPLVKRVAAAAGDRVCAAGEAVFVNGRLETLRRAHDPSGRPMPWWTGCEDLGSGDLFLLTPGVPEAFDGRYFGVTRRELVVGRARLLWRG
ncbi:MAG: S26 family signal peptidase [Sphingomonas sp.]|nr:S26 family signal peptidase [Sphingomonas sp.]